VSFMENQIPESIWIITDEESSDDLGARESTKDIGGVLGKPNIDTKSQGRAPVKTEKIKQEMDKFLQVIEYVFDHTNKPLTNMQLDELQLSVEVNGEGQVSLLGFGAKAGSKGAITLKFKRIPESKQGQN
jgi:hypothetical protein